MNWSGRLRLFCLVLLLLGPGSRAFSADVEIVVAEETKPHSELADALQRELPSQVTVSRSVAAAVRSAAQTGKPPDLVITVGRRALAAALRSRSAPIIASQIRRQDYERALREANVPNTAPVTAVYLEQTYTRQLNLVRLMLPDRQRIGVLLDSGHEEELRLLRSAAQSCGMTVIGATVASSAAIYEALARVLAESDLVLALPEPAIFADASIQYILMATYQARRPLFGFSGAQVRVGALAAVFSTTEQVARQVADMALRTLAGSDLPRPEYPRKFTVDVNFTVARSLGISAEDPGVLETKLRALEREP